ncbi:hypothetical protein [Nocardia donostiensis]|uniref:Uncharacterized protein n=1 Tax=Nocardia donostiensis TaxID=1538463 RepID=A0A1V2TH52_9NOCA|nr:hypothetical protein [Nocardia donostiensis]ONM48849.1 hypothetical protein B0T46_10235 [Nocardia donostiensis]OQS15532.1 hypothetical protein B0T36_09815 [Nocardia donostiensis]OQS22896.1 hypothetical protein B0T44_04230 [Nocardia donostiensis]
MAVLLAVLTLVPTIDCALLGEGGHIHVGMGAAVAADGAHHHHPHALGGHLADHCDQHMLHCVVKSVLPAGTGSLLSLLWLILLGTAAIVAAALLFINAGGVRAPPVAGLPTRNGQDILARFCIARR